MLYLLSPEIKKKINLKVSFHDSDNALNKFKVKAFSLQLTL